MHAGWSIAWLKTLVAGFGAALSVTEARPGIHSPGSGSSETTRLADLRTASQAAGSSRESVARSEEGDTRSNSEDRSDSSAMGEPVTLQESRFPHSLS